jgi:hypothetical protein
LNKADVGKVLAIALAIDARLGAPDETAFRAKVEGWSLALSDTMDFNFARDAVGNHYKTSTDAIMPAHLNAMWSSYINRQQQINNVLAIGSTTKSQGMPEEVRAKLVQMGLKRP